jgi:hypothetical protein
MLRAGREIAEILEGVDADQLLLFVEVNNCNADATLNGVIHIHVPVLFPVLISIKLLFRKLLVERLGQRLILNEALSEQFQGLSSVLSTKFPERVVLKRKVLISIGFLLIICRGLTRNIFFEKSRFSQNVKVLGFQRFLLLLGLEGVVFVLRDFLVSRSILVVDFGRFHFFVRIVFLEAVKVFVIGLFEGCFF